MTAIYNTFTGSSWAALTTYSVGDRKSNDSPLKCYECITPGLSAASGGPTGTGSNITDGVAHWKYIGSIDYTSLSSMAAAASALGTLTQPYIYQIMMPSGTDGTVNCGSVTFSGYTASASNTLTIQPFPGDGFRDRIGSSPLRYNTAYGVALVGNVNWTGGLLAGVAYTTVFGLQFSRTSNNGIVTTWRADSCIYKAVGVNAYGTTLVNCLIISPVGVVNNNATGTISCCTVVIPSNLAAGGQWGSTAYGPTSAIDNAIFNFTSKGASYAAIGYNAGDVAGEVPGSTGVLTSVAYTTATFVQPSDASNVADYRPASGSALISAGYTDTTNNPGAVDILGNARTGTWTIGCAQYVAAGGAQPRAFAVMLA